MDKLLLFATANPKDRRKNGGDSTSDRLSSVHTLHLLIGFAIIVQAGQLIGDPIFCWCPAHFTSTHTDYTNSVCWTTGTYYLPFSTDHIPDEESKTERKRIGYYQWVSLILLLQAVMFYIPRALWRMLSKRSGMAVSTITDAAIECQDQKDSEGRDKTIRYMVKHMGRFLLEINRYHLAANHCHKFLWLIYGNFLSIMYVFVKLVYLGNIIGQFYMLNAFLDTNFNIYGFDIISKMISGEEWTNSERFPRVTICDFKIRLLGNIHRYTVQCSLPLNLFNEIIFIFIWFWFAFVAAVTVASLLVWIVVMLWSSHYATFIRARLVAMDKIPASKENKRKIQDFISNYLRRDGYFIIKMVTKNSSDLIAAELIAGLWEHYNDNKRKFDSANAYNIDVPRSEEERENLRA